MYNMIAVPVDLAHTEALAKSIGVATDLAQRYGARICLIGVTSEAPSSVARTPQEFAFEHIHGALLAPLATFEPPNLPSQQGKRLVFHCGSGVRSRKVAEACLAAGMGPVAHLEGGFGAWKAARMPYVAIDPATGGIKRVDPAAG